MKIAWILALDLILGVEFAAGQSLGDLARQERERRAKQQQTAVEVTTDDLAKGKVEVNPPLDKSRLGDLNYLLQQLSRPRVSPELLRAILPLKDQALPKVTSLLERTDPLERVAPATTLTVLGKSEGLATMAHLLNDLTDAAQSASGKPATSEAATRQQLEMNRESGYALETTKLGVWRLTEGSALAPEQVVARLEKGPAIEIVGGVDNGQRLFNRALRDKDPNVRLGAIALIRVASGGNDFGFRADQAADQNEAAIQKITDFLINQRAAVMTQLAGKPKP